MERELKYLLASTLVIFYLSANQKLLWPTDYSDIAYIYYRTFIAFGVPLHSVPYVSWNLEYPALVGMSIYLSVYLGSFVSVNPQVGYGWVMAGILSMFAIGSVYFLYQICKLMNIELNQIFLYLIFTPTFIVFGFYNWDLMAVFFIILAIWAYLNHKEKLSAISVGLGICTKIYPVLLLPIILIDQNAWRKRVETVTLTGATFFLINIPFILLNFSGWWSTYYTAQWVNMAIENTFWIFILPIVQSMFYIKILSATMFSLFMIYILRSKLTLIQKFWATYAALLLSFTLYPPQFQLVLLPLFVLNPVFSLLWFYLFETMNASIIWVWFTLPPLPIWVLGTLRQLVLLLLFVQFVSRKPLPKLQHVWKWLTAPISPLEEKPKEIVVEEKIVKKPVKILPKIKKMVAFLVSPIEEEKKEEES